MAKKSKTKAEKFHMNKVADLGCIACRIMGYEDTPPQLHHIRGNGKDSPGIGQKSSNFEVIPLCIHHHLTGENAIHKNKANFEADFGTEKELLGMVEGLLSSAG